MKKLLVLFAIVSLFAFAGSAMAATTWTAPTEDITGHYNYLDDIAGHYNNVESDIVGHLNTIYSNGQDAYDWYIGYKQASAGASAAVTAANSAAGQKKAGDLISNLGLSNAIVASADTPTDASLAAMASLVADATEYSIPVTLPAVKIPTSNVTAGTTKMVVYVGTVGDASDYNNNQLLLYGVNPSTGGTAAVAKGQTQAWIVHGSTAVDNQSTMTSFVAGEDLFYIFVVGDTTSGIYGVNPSAVPSTSQGACVAKATTSGGNTLGGSGGGCAMGTSALALAVLGLFIAKRRG